MGNSLKDLTNRLGKGKNKIVNIALIILTLIAAPNIYISKAKKSESLNAQKAIELKKNEVLGRIARSEKKIKFYKDLFSKKDASLIMNTVNSIARDSNVKIILIKPGTEERESVYTKYPLVLTINVDGYHGLGKFISRIENHPDIYFVDEINIKTQSAASQPSSALTVNLTLNVIVFKG